MKYSKNIIFLTTIISIITYIVITTSISAMASNGLAIKLKIGDTTAYINDAETKLEAAPFIDPDSNRTLVPLRFISEALGAKVEWEEYERTVKWLDANAVTRSKVENVQNINITIHEGISSDVKYPITWYLRIGRKDAWNSNDVKKEDAFYDNAPFGNLASMTYGSGLMRFSKDIEQAPLIKDNKTMVPLRFIAEKIMNLDVQWDNATKSIILTQK